MRHFPWTVPELLTRLICDMLPFSSMIPEIIRSDTLANNSGGIIIILTERWRGPLKYVTLGFYVGKRIRFELRFSVSKEFLEDGSLKKDWNINTYQHSQLQYLCKSPTDHLALRTMKAPIEMDSFVNVGTKCQKFCNNLNMSPKKVAGSQNHLTP